MENNSQSQNKLKPLPIIGFALGIVSCIVSILVIEYPKHNEEIYHPGSGFAFLLVLFGIPILILFAISLTINIISTVKLRKTHTPIKDRNLILSILGLILSLSFVLAIPLTLQSFNAGSKAYSQKLQQASSQQNQQADTQTPNLILELPHYSDCYTYSPDENYRTARDSICSYLKYVYDNDFQEPSTETELLTNNGTTQYPKYLPEYISKLSKFESIIKINTDTAIERSDVNANFIITPHRNCAKETTESSISIWYLSKINDSEEENLICLFYDSRQDAFSLDFENSDNPSLYSIESKEFYEKILQSLQLAKQSNQFSFVLPYESHDESFLYDNRDFIDSFFQF